MAVVALALILSVLVIGVGMVLSALTRPRKSIQQICDETAEEMLPKIARDIFNDVLRDPDFAFFRFMKQIQARLQQVDPTMPDKEAFEMAKRIYYENLRDEGVEFGDPKFRWDASGAAEIADAYECDHWDRVA